VLDAVQNHLLMRHVQRDGRYGRSKEVMPSSSARNFNLEPDGKRFAVTNHPQCQEDAEPKNDRFVALLNAVDELRHVTPPASK